MFLTLVSTYGYTLNPVLKDIHFIFIVITALFLSAASLWLFIRWRQSKVDAGWLGKMTPVEFEALFEAVDESLVAAKNYGKKLSTERAAVPSLRCSTSDAHHRQYEIHCSYVLSKSQNSNL